MPAPSTQLSRNASREGRRYLFAYNSCRLQSFKAVKLPRVQDCRDDQNDKHRAGCHDSTYVEEQHLSPKDLNRGPTDQNEIANHQEGSQFSRAKNPVGDLEDSYRRSRQVDIDVQ